ncbi:MAG TPA: dUTP diphosphatase [Syntrophorhabdaceae bacterium]|nr:dUTP diphosphatase [Syntrophorhabdaceae bacterium]HOF56966.1 dUTP diphosphatase [Syntrophorhabdaceae bacterium]HOS04519.1 dUTP diphosphatase [Syntrophorhabdaceae bacterium]HPL40132.1 dUTP diphosphatase [Syntrophorhabdaceae bacterium]HQM76881.1 dUTP diphosphatase [Syntrophorhabdaceae bacterium]
MERLRVLISKREGAQLPAYETIAAAGMDLVAFIDKDIVLKPGERALIPTGILVGIPEGFEAEIRPRSGLALKYGVTILNAPGTIDSDYRGEIKVILINLGNMDFTVRNGDRIAQMVFKNVVRVSWEVVEELPETKRNKGGFGSTGINKTNHGLL